jgi:anti-sigma factor RsiW
MEHNKGHVDEGKLHAWLDGALSPDESARVEAHIASCATCSAAAAEARGLVAAASRILTALDDVPGGVAPTRALPERRHRLWTGWPLRAAAGVLFVVAGSLAVLKQMGTEHRVVATLSTPSVPSAHPVQAAPPISPPVAEKKIQPVRKQSAVAPPAARQPAPAAAARVVPQEDTTGDSTVTIAGRVVDVGTGQPVPGAQVYLSHPRVSAVTDSTGAYAMAVPAAQAAAQPAQLDVRRLGYQRAVDSLKAARQASPGDTVRRDFALQQAPMALSQVMVAGTARKEAPAAASGLAGGVAKSSVRVRYPSGCYAVDIPGLPGQIDLPSLRIPSSDSGRFRSKYWALVDPDSMRIMLTDTTGMTQRIVVRLNSDSVLRGQVTRSDSSAATPFVATRTGARCP